MNINNTNTLEWACRRGMLELDVLLGNFLREVYTALNEQDKQHFIDLLSCPDPELFDYLMGRSQPEDANLAKMTAAIRAHAKSRI
jgi:antitoxin CptB